MDLPLLTFGNIAKRDLLGTPHPVAEPRRHLDAAIGWLTRAHDKGTDGGVSYGYSLRGGWRPNYRETSGYIAETFYDLARDLGSAEHGERATRICRWLCRVQNPDGSISNPAYDAAKGIVFDTGQVLHGLVRGFEETGDAEILRAAEKAADWLTGVADGEKRWTRSTHNGIPHVYNTRSAWALLRLHKHRPTAEREAVGRANLDWALSQERNGYYEQNAFEVGLPPFTHTIAYAIRGLLESGWLMGDDRYVKAAENSARRVSENLRSDGFLAGTIDVQGRPVASYCCLTGNSQMGIIWARLYNKNRDELYRRSAESALRYVRSWQDITTSNLDVRGAIKGSQPVWGAYSRMTFPNWATKFFLDAMLLSPGLAHMNPEVNSIEILNGRFAPITLEQTVDLVSDRIKAGERGYLCTVNVAILMMMRQDPRLQRFVDTAAMVVADGQPLIWGSRMLGRRLPERVAGVELVERLCERAAREGFGVYLLGGKKDVVEKVAARFTAQFPGLRLSGVADGYFKDDEAEARADAVARSGAKILIAAMGVPRQELFIEEQWERLGVPFAIGVGGSFDVLAGLRARAPQLVQRVGLEWLFRLAQEPGRLWKRYLVTNAQFLYLMSREILVNSSGG